MDRFRILTISLILILNTVNTTFLQLTQQVIKERIELLDVEGIVESFVNGTHLFDNIPNNTGCYLSNYPGINEDLFSIIYSIQTFDYNNDVSGQIIKIIQFTEKLIKNVQILYSNCKQLLPSIENRINDLQTYFKQPTYVSNLVNHTINNLPELSSRILEVSNLLNNMEYQSGAFQLGEFYRYTSFWDFQ